MPEHPTTGTNILIVDDNPANLNLLGEMLRVKGYEVRSFPRGRLALAAATKSPPDLILLDINMPEMNGYEVCEHLKSTEETAGIPVIFLSALGETDDKVRAFRAGGVDYISKPFQLEEVQARVETHLKLHALRLALRRQNEHLEETVAIRTAELGKRVEQTEAARKSLENEIDGHRQTLAALKESEERYRVVAETARDAIITINEDGVILFANPAAETIFGHVAANMTGRNVTMLMPENLRTVYLSRISRFLTKDAYDISRHAITFPGLHQSGKEIPLEISIGESQKNGERSFTGIVRDITERKQAELVLRQSEVQYRLLFQLNPHPMWVYSEASLKFLAANNAASQNYEYSNGEFLAMALTDLIPADGISSLSMLSAALPDGQARLYRKKDGTVVTAEVTDHPIHFAGQDAILAIATDITERKQLEQQFYQAQRLESVGRLAGGVAHDFNNLLTIINGYAEMTLGEATLSKTARHRLTEIRKAGEQAATLTRQLLAFSRRELVQPAVVNINTIILGIHSMLTRLIGEDIDLRTNLAPDLGNILADAGQIQQILMNLAVNSRDAMRDGGILSVETSNITFDEIHANVPPDVTPGKYLILAVTDTGIGMPPEVMERIFEPFFTTKPTGVGTGLGLATVYGLVKQAGGWIRVLSEPGNGTAFQIYFPRVDQQPSEVKYIVTTDFSGNETVLVVEDQREVRELALSALREYGYIVYGAAGGVEALQFIREFDGTIDLVITDVVMPGMNGRELVNQLRPLLPGVRVLFMSGYTDDVIATHGVLEGEAAHLDKPFTPTSLGKKVRETLGLNSGSEGINAGTISRA